MAGDYSRTQRIADYLKRELALLIQKEMRDPRVGMVSVTDAEVSRDLSYAKVFVTLMDTEDKKAAREVVEVLNKAAGFLRSRIASESNMRTTPRLRFHFDDSVRRGRDLEALIDRAVSTDAKAEPEE